MIIGNRLHRRDAPLIGQCENVVIDTRVGQVASELCGIPILFRLLPIEPVPKKRPTTTLPKLNLPQGISHVRNRHVAPSLWRVNYRRTYGPQPVRQQERRDFLKVPVAIEMKHVLRPRKPPRRQCGGIMRTAVQSYVAGWKFAHEGEAREHIRDAVQPIVASFARKERGSKAKTQCASRERIHTYWNSFPSRRFPIRGVFGKCPQEPDIARAVLDMKHCPFTTLRASVPPLRAGSACLVRLPRESREPPDEICPTPEVNVSAFRTGPLLPIERVAV